jgi:hypothetical protein
MEYKEFSEIIDRLKEYDSSVQKAHKVGVDLYDFADGLHRVISILIKDVYGEEGADWFSWFCYESEYGEKDWNKGNLDTYETIDGKMVKVKKSKKKKYGATDENGKPIFYSVKSTWEYLEENYRTK